MLKSDALALTWRRQELRRDSKHRNSWVEASACEAVEPANVGLIICDVWDNHWSRGARERLEALVPRIDGVISAARSRGVLIVHAPSDTMDFYADAPARKRIRSVEKLTPPVVRSVPDMPLPIDDSDGGSDTQEASREANWTRQHPGIRID